MNPAQIVLMHNANNLLELHYLIMISWRESAQTMPSRFIVGSIYPAVRAVGKGTALPLPRLGQPLHGSGVNKLGYCFEKLFRWDKEVLDEYFIAVNNTFNERYGIPSSYP